MEVAKRTRRMVARWATALALTVGAVGVTAVLAEPAHAATICDQFGTTTAGPYVIMNNRWGTSATQCINTTSNGFSIIQQDGMGNLSGAPTAYPAIYLGCHYSNCSPSSPLPRQISQIGSANSSVSVTYPSSGTFDGAYDIWLNATTDVSGVQDTEIMIWLNHTGSIQPVGSNSGTTVNIAGHTWQVWTGNNGQNNVVSYVGTPAGITSLSFNVMDFINNTLSRGSQYGTTSWFLTSIQMGFEPWIGGVGLAVNSFSATIGGGGQSQPPPPPNVPGTPGTPTASNVTANSATLSWGASSGTVTNYVVERATGASSTNFSQVGTPTGTTFTDSNLAASTTYRYRVRAVNSAGSSGTSGITNVTTSGGGQSPPPSSPPPGNSSCSVTFNAWDTGFVANVTVNGPASGWSIPFTLGSGSSISNSWSVTLSGSGTNFTGTNVSYNANVPAGQSTTWGFQASRPVGGALPTFPTCTVR